MEEGGHRGMEGQKIAVAVGSRKESERCKARSKGSQINKQSNMWKPDWLVCDQGWIQKCDDLG